MSKRYFSSFPDPKDKGDATNDAIVTVHAPIPKLPEIHFETQKIEEAPEIPDVPDVEFLVLTSKDINSKTDDELVAILSGESYPDKCLSSSTISLINTQLISRAVNKASNPHWSLTPTFWFIVITTVLTGIAAWPVIQQWLPQKIQSEPLNLHEVNYQQLHVPTEIEPQPEASQSTFSSTVSQNQDLSESLKTHKQSMPEEKDKKQE